MADNQTNSNSNGDIIEDVLVDSELAKQLVPNKFKFTSQQGRVRRQKLLAAAKKLSEDRRISDITLADVCEEAGIPRASAYHFFPNVEAIFLALRFLSAIETLEALETVDITQYDRWQGYIMGLLNKIMEIFNDDPTKARLVFEANAPEFADDTHGEKLDFQVIKLAYKHLSSQYVIPEFDNIKEMMLIAYGIIYAVLKLSYRQHGKLTDHMRQEAVTACIAYMRCYLPEKPPRKNG